MADLAKHSWTSRIWGWLPAGRRPRRKVALTMPAVVHEQLTKSATMTGRGSIQEEIAARLQRSLAERDEYGRPATARLL